MDNWKAILYLLAFGQGMILSLALIVRGISGRRAGLFLGLIVYVLALELLNAWGMQVRYHSRPGMFPFWNFQSYLIIPLSLWFFMEFSTRPTYTFRARYWFLFLPVALEIVISCTWRFFWHHSHGRVSPLLQNPVWFFATELLPIIGMFAVLTVYGARLIRLQSAFRRQRVRWSGSQFLKCYGVFGFLSVLTVLWAAGVVLSWLVFSEIELLLTACLFVLGYAGYLNPDFFQLPMLPLTKITEKPDFGMYDDGAELGRLRAAFEQGALHTQSKLTIDDVAARLRLPSRYISHLVNTHCGCNFNTFVNNFRVSDVIRKLGDPKEQHKTILALALEAGFSSKSTFNQVFKQHTGKSPSQYLPSENQSQTQAF